MAYSRASRSIRDSMRQHYERLINACRHVDTKQTGYLSPHGLWKIINELMPLKFEDLRLMLRQVVSVPPLSYSLSVDVLVV
jgi:hypothetical protein